MDCLPAGLFISVASLFVTISLRVLPSLLLLSLLFFYFYVSLILWFSVFSYSCLVYCCFHIRHFFCYVCSPLFYCCHCYFLIFCLFYLMVLHVLVFVCSLLFYRHSVAQRRSLLFGQLCLVFCLDINVSCSSIFCKTCGPVASVPFHICYFVVVSVFVRLFTSLLHIYLVYCHLTNVIFSFIIYFRLFSCSFSVCFLFIAGIPSIVFPSPRWELLNLALSVRLSPSLLCVRLSHCHSLTFVAFMGFYLPVLSNWLVSFSYPWWWFTTFCFLVSSLDASQFSSPALVSVQVSTRRDGKNVHTANFSL